MTQRAISLTPMRVAPGARLARDVLRHDGQILLTAGTLLENETIAHLFERGIEMIWITVEDTRDDATRSEQLYAAETRVQQSFRGPGNSVRDELRDALLAHRRQQVQ
jgi:hypothetical protein